MKNLVAQKWIDECGTLFPIDGNTILYPTPGPGIFELYQGKGQDKRIGLRRLSEKFEFNHKIYDVGCDDLFDIIQKTWESDKFVEEKNWKKINSLEISLKTIVDIIKKKDTYLIVGDSKTVMNILNSSESLRFL